jgi:hypothetical protein
MGMPRELFQFIVSVLSLQFVLLGGCVLTVLVGFYEKFIAKKAVSVRAYVRVIVTLMFFACFQAWQQEHRSKIGREGDLHAQEGLTLSQKLETQREANRHEQCEGSLREAQNSLSRFQGAVGAQTSQIQAQQGTINGCLTQAMKLLTPEALRLSFVALPPIQRQKATTKSANYLVLVNKTITPVRMSITCKTPAHIEASVLGTGTQSGSFENQDYIGTEHMIAIDSPAFGPSSPLLVSLDFNTEQEPDCQFSQR